MALITAIILTIISVAAAGLQTFRLVEALRWHEVTYAIWQPATITAKLEYAGNAPQAMMFFKPETVPFGESKSATDGIGEPVDIAHFDANTLTLSHQATAGTITVKYRTMGASKLNITHSAQPNKDTVIRGGVIDGNHARFNTFVGNGTNREGILSARVILFNDKHLIRYEGAPTIIPVNTATSIEISTRTANKKSLPQGKYRVMVEVSGTSPDDENDKINASQIVGEMEMK